jgi:hypothetical protein
MHITLIAVAVLSLAAECAYAQLDTSHGSLDTSHSSDEPTFYLFGPDTRGWDSLDFVEYYKEREFDLDTLEITLSLKALARADNYLVVLLAYEADTNNVRVYGQEEFDIRVRATREEIEQYKNQISTLYRKLFFGPWLE